MPFKPDTIQEKSSPGFVPDLPSKSFKPDNPSFFSRAKEFISDSPSVKGAISGTKGALAALTPGVFPEGSIRKKVVIEKPREIAENLRKGFVSTINPRMILGRAIPGIENIIPKDLGAGSLSEEAILKKASETGKVPLGRIAANVATRVAGESIPLTPEEAALFGAAGKGLQLAGKAAKPALKAISKRFPRIPEALTSPISKVPEIIKRGPAKVKPPTLKEAQLAREEIQALASPAVKQELETVNRLMEPKAPASGGKDFFGQQLDKFNVVDDSKHVFKEVSDVYKNEINVARRGKIDNEGTKKLAQNLGMSEQELIKRNAGQAFNAEQLEAAKALTGASLERVTLAKNVYTKNPTMENLINLRAAIAKHATVQESFLGARAEAGRALQILRNVTDPEKNQQALLDAIGGQELTKEMAERLARIDPADIAAMNKFIRDVSKASTSDKLFEVWINSILSSPLTHKKNIIGNSMFIASKLPEKAIAGGIDAVTGLVTGKRTIFAGEVLPEAFGIFDGIKEGARRALHSITNPVSEVKLELRRLPSIKGKLGKVIRTPTKALVVEDEFAKGVISQMELSAQAFRKAKLEKLTGEAFAKRVAELKQNPTDDILKAIKDEELMRTFQNPLGKTGKALSALRRDTPGGKFILPFLQTPFNIAKAGIARSPLGFFNTARLLASKAGQQEVVTSAAQATYGSIISASVAYYTAQGKVTGAPPKNPAERDKFYRDGKQPYSVNINGKWHSYTGLEPISIIVGATAGTVQRAMEEGKEVDPNVAGAIVASIPKYLLSQTFMSSIRDFLDAMDDPERSGRNFVNRLSGSIIPFSSFGRFVAQRIDPVIRRPTSIWEAIKIGLPGLSKDVTARLNVFGEEIKRPTDLFSTILTQRRTEDKSIISREDEELERITGFPGKIVGGIRLNPQEFRKVLETSGTIIKQTREKLLSTPKWKQIPTEDRKRIIEAIERFAREEGRRGITQDIINRLPNGDKKNRFILARNKQLNLSRKQRSQVLKLMREGGLSAK